MKKATIDESSGDALPDALILLENFLKRAHEDPRIGPVHISIYLGLWKLWRESGGQACGIRFFSYQLRPLGKVSSYATFHRVIRDLHAFGYIEYTASYNRFIGSLAQLFY